MYLQIKVPRKSVKMSKSIPKWISLVSALLSLLGLFVGFSLYFSPAKFMDQVDFSGKGVHFLTNMWAARQIAIASIIGYSVIRQSSQMLLVSLGAYCLMNLQDIFIGISMSDSGLGTGASIFTLISGSMIILLVKSKKEN